MTALVLFPSRIRFVNDDGTLTPEAYRALQEIVNRTGGTLGSVGSDTYSDVVAGFDAADPVNMEMVVQSGTADVVATGSTTTGTATLDFGAKKTDTSVYVADANIGSGSFVAPFIKPTNTATNTVDNHIFEHIEVVAVPAIGGVTLYGKVAQGFAHGSYAVGYTVN